MPDAQRLLKLLGRLKEVCDTATELTREVKGQLQDVERARQSEYRAARRRSASAKKGGRERKTR